MSADRFDFEQQIQKCWMITDDISDVSEGILEHNLDQDQIVNALMGIKQLYELKFNKLWDLFEHPIMDIVRENKMLNEECSALRAQLQEAELADTTGYGIAAIKPKKKDKK
jgi:regulator of replication initiation timing